MFNFPWAKDATDGAEPHSIFYALPGNHQPGDYRFPRIARAGEVVCLRIGSPSGMGADIRLDGESLPGHRDDSCGQQELLYEFVMPHHDVTISIALTAS